MNEDNFKIVSFYEFKNIKSQYLKYKNSIKEICSQNNLRGTVILSQEGINGTLSGFDESIDNFLRFLKNLQFNNGVTTYNICLTRDYLRMK